MGKYNPNILHESDGLKINEFPDPVEQFLSNVSLSNTDLDDRIASEFASSGLDDTEERKLESITEMVRRDSLSSQTKVRPDERVAEQLIGTLCTCLYERERAGLPPQQELKDGENGGRKIRLNVDTLDNGKDVYLHYPGDKAFGDSFIDHPFDIMVFLEDYQGISDDKTEMPHHNEFFSDIWWKSKEHHTTQVGGAIDDLREAIDELYCGEEPKNILCDSRDLDDFTVGRRPEILFRTVFWIFQQEDLNYPRYSDEKYDGRRFTYRPTKKILNTQPSDFGTDSGYYGGSNDPDDYSTYYEIFKDIKGHYNYTLYSNSQLQTDRYSC